MILLLAALIAIDEGIPEGPFCYPGKHKREVITFDPQSAPLFEQAYQTLKNRLIGLTSEQEILLETVDFVQRDLFDLPECTNQNVIQLILHEGMGEIPLETFLREKKGVCRHLALTVTLLVDSLVRDGTLSGKALLIREDLLWGRHAWTLYLSESGAWHLDAFYGIMENGKTRAGFSLLCQKYGCDAMMRQQARWEHDN